MLIDDVLMLSPILPVVVIDDPRDAVPIARALVRGGVNTIEITLRTPRALDAVRRVTEEVPEIVVGVGTVTRPVDIENARRAGAQFLVTPGAGPTLLDALDDASIPVLPGVGTVSEIIAASERGYSALKFFPAESSGGSGFLRAIAGPLPEVRFCPTGGIDPSNAMSYLALPNVLCVGGSWLTPTSAVKQRDWGLIEGLADEMLRSARSVEG
jgi:2-dehydro-3-deoxyphosphogluconate aldolase/(4S)-4-hydroxy-2-oxoglutarate aldolase